MQDVPTGVSVCLTCFASACFGEQRHAALHHAKTGHALFVTLTRTLKPRAPLTKVQVVEAPEEDAYDYTRTVRCVACDPAGGRVLPLTDELERVTLGVLHARSSSHAAEVRAWEEELVPCAHTRALAPAAQPLDLRGATCAECELTGNLWLCLTCGHLGCGRAQLGGAPGHSHGLAHYEASGHPCSVKQGTITAEGEGDVYCYACDDARIDPALAEHLAQFGMHVAQLQKTEKSMTELQLEQNARFDFAMTTDDGRALTPLYGPGHTGLRNLGNSCYLASVVQALYALPSFRARYNTDTHAAHVAACTAAPASCLACQLGKLGDGLLSGRYAVPAPGAEAPAFQAGIRPAMLKALLGRGHAEFATMRQQDADEFLQFFVEQVHRQPHAPLADPTAPLAFVLEHRLQCTRCGGVRYTDEVRDVGLGVPVRVAERPTTDRHADAASGRLYEPVSLDASLAELTAPERVPYRCPACAAEVDAERCTRFKTFPRVLVVQAQRFQVVNWVPQKVNVPFFVPLETPLDVHAFQGRGLQPDETVLPDDAPEPAAAEPAVDAEALTALTAMGFSEPRATRALRATGADAEAAANWLFERMDDASLDAPLDDAAGGGAPDTSALEEMGFTATQAAAALRATGGDAEAAVAWLFEHPEAGSEAPAAPTPPAAGSEAPGAPVGPAPGLADAPRYRLASFVTHRGPSVHSGHYVAHVRQPSGEWALFNDEKVAAAPLHSDGRDEDDASVERLSQLYVPSLTQCVPLRVLSRRGPCVAARRRREAARASPGTGGTCRRRHAHTCSRTHSPSRARTRSGSARRRTAGTRCARVRAAPRRRQTAPRPAARA